MTAAADTDKAVRTIWNAVQLQQSRHLDTPAKTRGRGIRGGRDAKFINNDWDCTKYPSNVPC